MRKEIVVLAGYARGEDARWVCCRLGCLPSDLVELEMWADGCHVPTVIYSTSNLYLDIEDDWDDWLAQVVWDEMDGIKENTLYNLGKELSGYDLMGVGFGTDFYGVKAITKEDF